MKTDTDENMIDLVTTMINDTKPITIIRMTNYRFHALLASSFINKRIILLGDAIHQSPPFLGQGLCSGIRDAWNVCWKLKMILKKQSSLHLLDSYFHERYSHVSKLIILAIIAGRMMTNNHLIHSYMNRTISKCIHHCSWIKLYLSKLPIPISIFNYNMNNQSLMFIQCWMKCLNGIKKGKKQMLDTVNRTK
jgi:hypothetical protein